MTKRNMPVRTRGKAWRRSVAISLTAMLGTGVLLLVILVWRTASH